jgi:hypothetical protein
MKGQMPRECPVTELRPGLTVWNYDSGHDRYIRDGYLKDYFIGDYSVTEFMRRVQFLTSSGQIWAWHPCGTVFVTDGRDDRKVITVKQDYPEGLLGLQMALIYQGHLKEKGTK